MTEHDYAYVADAYERISGEPLEADGEFVAPYWEATWIAVELDKAWRDRQVTISTEKLIQETADRVAAMIFIQSHGVTLFRKKGRQNRGS
jgi:hypothetical protein